MCHLISVASSAVEFLGTIGDDSVTVHDGIHCTSPRPLLRLLPSPSLAWAHERDRAVIPRVSMKLRRMMTKVGTTSAQQTCAKHPSSTISVRSSPGPVTQHRRDPIARSARRPDIETQAFESQRILSMSGRQGGVLFAFTPLHPVHDDGCPECQRWPVDRRGEPRECRG